MNSNNQRHALGDGSPRPDIRVYSQEEIEEIIAEEQAKNNREGNKPQPPTVTEPVVIPTPTNIANPENYIILDGRNHGSYSYPDILVAMDKSYQGKDWNQSHEELDKNSEYMLTIRQFADFLNLLKTGKAFDGRGKAVDGKRLTSILNDIIKVKGPWRSERLDAKFGNGTISYHLIENNGSREIKEQLTDYLASDKTPGIDMDNWLSNANEHGLPRANVKSGSLYYYAPTDGRVAWFDAGSVRACLVCDGGPSYTDSSLGVRAVRIKTGDSQ